MATADFRGVEIRGGVGGSSRFLARIVCGVWDLRGWSGGASGARTDVEREERRAFVTDCVRAGAGSA